MYPKEGLSMPPILDYCMKANVRIIKSCQIEVDLLTIRVKEFTVYNDF